MPTNEIIGGMPFDAKQVTDFSTGVVSYDREYPAREFASYFGSFIGNGIFPNPSNGFKVVAAGSMGLSVLPGKVWINGYYKNQVESLTLSVPTADGSNPRIDYVVARLNLVERYIEIVIKEGTPSATPTAPELIQTVDTSGDYYELGLATIYVATGVTVITDANITDKRLSNDCGIVTGIIDQVDTSELYNQYSTYLDEQIALWNSIRDDQESTWSDQTNLQQTSWETQTENQQSTWETQTENQQSTWETQTGQQQTDWETQTEEQENQFTTEQTKFNQWFNTSKADITTLQSFFFYNWFELPGCTYIEYPKNDQGEYISTITAPNDVVIARQKEWKNEESEDYYTQITTYSTTGEELRRVQKVETKNDDGTYVSTVTGGIYLNGDSWWK